MVWVVSPQYLYLQYLIIEMQLNLETKNIALTGGKFNMVNDLSVDSHHLPRCMYGPRIVYYLINPVEIMEIPD